ncbi:cytochrome c biogenesis heme-transporting ATPase CcmA [Pseudoduganella sp. SL102]|nr:cytochrome c biogenesis heme-transporting ATPase CcmA [Pseudoduganella sp. SL102]WBS00971.1 cytochrome c biogenesis heme-transporting ATPase CcmA [Pseudoduganella sp. SL102]
MSLRCRNLIGRLGDRVLFSGVALELFPHDVLRVTGSNGSGKTTLLRMLAGLRRPDAGDVSWHGADIAANAACYRDALLYIGHAPGIKDCLTAWENLAYAGSLDGPDARRTALAALDRVGLGPQADLRVQALSQGQRRRVALARLHLPLPRPVWILDEPFVGLDCAATDTLCAAMQAHRDGGGIVVYTTHQDAGPPDVRHLGMETTGQC